MMFRTRRCKADRSRVRYRRAADKAVLRAGHNMPARRDPAYKDRKVPDRQRCDWHRGWHRNGHRPRPARGRRENRAHARRKSCPRAKAAPAVGTRPLLACAESHRAAQIRGAASAMLKSLGKDWAKLETADRTENANAIPDRLNTATPSPSRLSTAAPEMSLKLGQPLGAIDMCARPMGALQAQRFTKRSMSSSAVANEVTSRMRTLSGPASKFPLLRT